MKRCGELRHWRRGYRDRVYFRHRADEPLRGLRNCGAQTFHQIRAWAEFNVDR